MDGVWKDTKNRELAYQAIIEGAYKYPVQEGWSELTHAAFHGHLAIVDTLLIDFGWDPDTPDMTGLTALYAAAAGDEVAMVKRLLYWGANPHLEEACET